MRKIIKKLISLHDDYMNECGVISGASFWCDERVRTLMDKLSLKPVQDNYCKCGGVKMDESDFCKECI